MCAWLTPSIYVGCNLLISAFSQFVDLLSCLTSLQTGSYLSMEFSSFLFAISPACQIPLLGYTSVYLQLRIFIILLCFRNILCFVTLVGINFYKRGLTLHLQQAKKSCLIFNRYQLRQELCRLVSVVSHLTLMCTPLSFFY